MSSSPAAVGPVGGSQKWQVFICYRQDDGRDVALWLHRQLDGATLPAGAEADQEAATVSVYLDQAAPAVDDWTRLHRPALERSVALLFICSPGAQHRQGEEDWVHRELDWWLEHREAAPIIVDPLDRGARYMPDRLKTRWPNAQRVLVEPVAWQAMGVDERAETVQRTVERILQGIRIGAGRSLREDYERELARRRTLERQRHYLIAALVAATLGIAGMVWLGQVARGRARSLRASAVLGQAAVADDPLTSALLIAELDGSLEPENGRRLARDIATAGVPVFALGIDGPRVDQFAVSADGRWLATSTEEGKIAVHPIDGRGRPIALDGHEKRVNQLVFAADGRRLASASDDGHATIWTLDGSVPPLVLRHSGEVEWIAFRPGTDQVATSAVDRASGSADRRSGSAAWRSRIRIWSLESENPIAEVVVEDGINRLWMSPTGGHLLTVSGRSGADLWPLGAGIGAPISVVGELKVAVRGRSQGAFSPTGDRVAVACSDGSAIVVPTSGIGARITLGDYRQEASSLAFSPSGESILVGYLDGAAWLWPVAAGAGRPFLVPGVGSAVWATGFLGSGSVVVSTYNGSVRIVRTSSSSDMETYVLPLEGHRGRPTLAVTPDWRSIVSLADGVVRVWRTASTPTEPFVWVDASLDPQILLDQDAEPVTSVSIHAADRRIAAGTVEGSIFVWPADGKGKPRRIAAHANAVIGVAWAGDALLASADVSSARIWRLGDSGYAMERELACEEGWVWALAASARPQRYGLACGDQALVWSEGSERPQILGARGEGQIQALRFHPTQSSIATGSTSGIVRLWTLTSPPSSAAVRVAGVVTSLAFDATGRWLAVGTGAFERALTVHATDTLRTVFEAPARQVTSVAFSTDGSELATGSDEYRAENAASIWRWRLGDTRPVQLGHHLEPVSAVAFDPLTDRLVTGSQDQTLRVWRTSFPDLVEHLGAVTAVCLAPDSRARLLFERPSEALAAFEQCERRYQRGL